MSDSIYRITGGIRNETYCADCGGLCCQLYSRCWHEGGFLHKVDRWYKKLDEYLEEFGKYTPFAEMLDVEGLPEPRFDPIRAWGQDDVEYRQELIAAGVNPKYCEYNDGSGCTIEWFQRPRVCREYRCLKWKVEEHLAQQSSRE